MKLQKWVFLTLFLLLCSGCAAQSIKLPKVADLNTPAQAKATVGMAMIEDNRGSQDAGQIGGLKLKAGDDLKTYISTIIRNKLAEKGYTVQLAENPGKKTGTETNNYKTVVVMLQSASSDSADAIMFPVESEVNLTLQVYDPAGKIVYAKQYKGLDSKRMGVMVSQSKIGVRLAAAADAAAQNIVDDSEFLKKIQ